jgi:hypothetical protein
MLPLEDAGRPAVAAFSDEVRLAVLRGAETPDYFSTRPSADLQSILRNTRTLPIAKLINTGEVKFDFQQKRIFRDSFWKGSFAKDTLLGWEERIRDAVLGNGATEAGSIFAGGSFWKRFDHIRNGTATGYVVNYEVRCLPGEPRVQQVAYPDDHRRYFKQGDAILLLNYTNDPYKLVYDTIKVIDEDNAIGVMHIGIFPTGAEFATFVMARNNYPFDKMSVEDHNLLFADPRTSAPTLAQLEGTWNGSLVFVTHPDSTLLNQVNPVAFHLTFAASGAQMQARYRFGLLSGSSKVQLTHEFVQLVDRPTCVNEIRMIDASTMIGRWVSVPLSSSLTADLRNHSEPAAGGCKLYYVLTRGQ